jgi:release factor glutamine methyltransferase
MTTISQLLDEAQAQLLASDSPRLDAEVLLSHVTGHPRSHLFAWPEEQVEERLAEKYRDLVSRRAGGEPVAHLTGEREFWSLELKVTPDTLIPRPDTELLVEQALAIIPEAAGWDVADLGTGSGAIALAIGRERPGCRVVAVEQSEGALRVAQENGRRHGITNVTFRSGSWFDPLAGEKFELIVSNPPYVASYDPHLSEGDVRFEPRSALVAGADGLDDIRYLIANAPRYLKPGGWLLLEHGFDQGRRIQQLFYEHGYRPVTGFRDYQGHDRVTAGCFEG